ncbi:LLM class flavin-dependent oxidoreductase [Roseiarcaceae bacterium H3SJ34-1]|uniref:LLM class flavin-dependent oxidoreductase n=1 Tax=Terripilifer ovatus TaxID=3032367 RepID=UPI003AB99C96|nr:LLM class flavin-dependent oxidoreductase [Roseiarcaceae bacterium H3SJ34-1]
MQLGIWAPLPHTISREPEIDAAVADLKTPGQGQPVDRSYQFVLDTVRRAEAIGFDITLVAERLVAPDLEAWLVSSALAVQTSKIQIMTAVHPGIIAPQVVAKMGASLDRLSGGRFVVNVVPGRRSHEFDLYGNGGWLDGAEGRYTRVDEFIHVMKGLWTEDPFDFDGEFYPVRNGSLATKPLRQPAPPIYAASSDDRAKETIARTCNLWFVSHEPGHVNYERNMASIASGIAQMKERATRHGRTLGFGISTLVLPAASMDGAYRLAAEIESDPALNVAAKALGAGLMGPPQVIADRIRRYEDIGMTCLMLQFHPMKQGLDRFANDIMPLLR